MHPEIVLKSGKDRAVRRRHPWVFSGAVKERPRASAGDIVSITDNKGKHLAMAHIDPASSIIARIFEFTPEPFQPDSAYWQQKFENALEYRKSLTDLNDSNAWRFLHAEGDFMPGLITDVYGQTASIQVRTHGGLSLLEELCAFLKTQIGIKNIYVQADETVGESNTGWKEGQGQTEEFTENGVRFHTDIEQGQKTGFFLDQRENRKLLRDYSTDKSVLDCFCYSGGFSMNAMMGGAKEVVSVDISDRAGELCKKHAELNDFDTKKHEILTVDCFDYLRQLENGRFEVIILDPPAFTKHISTVKKAARGYQTINEKALRALPPGGLLFTFSCSQHISQELFRKIIFSAASEARRDVRIMQQLHQGADHPINIYHPEGEYLKGLLLRVS